MVLSLTCGNAVQALNYSLHILQYLSPLSPVPIENECFWRHSRRARFRIPFLLSNFLLENASPLYVGAGPISKLFRTKVKVLMSNNSSSAAATNLWSLWYRDLSRPSYVYLQGHLENSSRHSKELGAVRFGSAVIAFAIPFGCLVRRRRV
jgi:hypothetical protein